MSRALGDVLFADNLQGLIKELGQADKLDEWGKRVGVEGATDGEGTGGSGRLQKQLEREREREREIKRGQGKRKEESNVPEWSGNVEVFRPFLYDTR